MTYLNRFLDQARLSPRRLVFPESGDDRIVEAARRLENQGLAQTIVLPADRPERSIDAERLDVYSQLLMSRRDRLSEGMAKRLLAKPLMLAGAIVAAGDADAMIAGAANPTRRVIEAGMMTVGLAPGIDVPSSFFLMVTRDEMGRPGRQLVFADCAVNIDPTAEELAAIAIASAASAGEVLKTEARVALLSFSTHGSASHPAVEKVARALEIAEKRAPNILIDGEMQADTALSTLVASKKVRRESAVAGQANVLIFPDLDAGNIAYKLVQQLAGAVAVGPFLQGFAKPICDLSRGATVDEIVAASVIATAQVGN